MPSEGLEARYTEGRMLSLRSLSHSAACLSAMLAFCAEAHAGPEAKVRVRGSSRIEATTTATTSGFVLQGSLREDSGRPVASARVRVRLLSPDGSPRLLQKPDACAAFPSPEPGEPYREREEAVALTDASGRFCLRWPFELPSGRLSISYDDQRLLLDSTQQLVPVQRVAPIELDFVPAPTHFSVDVEQGSVTLVSRSRSVESPHELPLALTWTRPGAPTVTLLTRTFRVGETAQLRFPTRLLGAPGPGELRARLGTGDAATETQARVIASGTVELVAPTEVGLSSGGDGVLKVELKSRVGAVGSGAVEALVGNRTVGIAAVDEGRASIVLDLGSGPQKVPLAVRYLPASPWWIAGDPRVVEVTVPRASVWRGVFWAASLLAVATYIASAWRRPPRLTTPRETTPAEALPLEPRVSWTAQANGTRGHTGVVTDAHDGAPIGGAVVLVIGSGAEERRTVTEPDGTFRLAPFESAPGSRRLRVEGLWHTAHEWPLPPDGHLSVALVTRRRAVLARLLEWTRQRGALWSSGPLEPTPADLARSAESVQEPHVAQWARAVESAAFGPTALDSQEEARIRALEPEPQGDCRDGHGRTG